MLDTIVINNQESSILGYSTNENYVDALGGQKLKTNLKRLFNNTEERLIQDGDNDVYGGRTEVPQQGTWQIKSQYANKKIYLHRN